MPVDSIPQAHAEQVCPTLGDDSDFILVQEVQYNFDYSNPNDIKLIIIQNRSWPSMSINYTVNSFNYLKTRLSRRNDTA